MNPMLWSFSLPVVGKVEFPAYMTMLILGLALATWLARREEDRAGRNGDRIVDMHHLHGCRRATHAHGKPAGRDRGQQ